MIPRPTKTSYARQILSPYVEGDLLDGASCKRGEDYAVNEFREPKRMLITTMRVENGELPVIPVRSKDVIPKDKIFDAVLEVNKHSIKAPVKMGDILIPNLLGLEIPVIASRDLSVKTSKFRLINSTERERRNLPLGRAPITRPRASMPPEKGYKNSP